MKLLSLVAFVFISVSAHAEEPTASCDINFGVCARMDDVADTYVRCSGDACYSLWRLRFRQMDSLTNAIDYLNFTLVDSSMAEKAANLSRAICGSRTTGPTDWVVKMVRYENSLLRRLKALQESSPNFPVNSCTKRLN